MSQTVKVETLHDGFVAVNMEIPIRHGIQTTRVEFRPRKDGEFTVPEQAQLIVNDAQAKAKKV